MIFKNRPLAFTIFSFCAALYCCFLLNGTAKIIAANLFFITAVIVIIVKQKIDIVFCSLLAVVLAVGFSYFSYDIPMQKASDLFGAEHTVEAQVNEISYSDDETLFLNAQTYRIDDAENSINIRMNIYYSDEIVSVGDIIKISGVVNDFNESDIGFNEKNYYRSKGIYASLENNDGNLEIIGHNSSAISEFFNSARKYCSDVIDKYCDLDISPILKALCIGDKSTLDSSVKSDFSRIGASHILAISGMHLAILMGMILTLFEFFTLNRRICAVLISFLCIAYIIISGGSYSVIRAGIMFILMSLAILAGRKSDSLTSLFAALLLIILFSPNSIFDIGLILSFSATFGMIVVSSPLIKKINSRKINRVFAYFIISVITTLSALSFSIIPICIYFDSFCLISPITNIILAPFVTVILFALPILIIISPIGFLSYGFGGLLSIITKAFYSIVSYFAGFNFTVINMNYPFMYICIIVFCILLFVVLLLKRKMLLLIPFFSFFLCYGICFGIFSVGLSGCHDIIFISENSSDSILIADNSTSVLLDFAQTSKTHETLNFNLLTSELYQNKLDCWIISTYNQKYSYGIINALENQHIDMIMFSEPITQEEKTAYSDIEYYASLNDCSVEYFKYDTPIEIDSISLVMKKPISFEKTEVKIPFCDISLSGESIIYFGSAYFDYAENETPNCNYLFSGSFGYRGKRKIIPTLNTETLIYTDHKYADVSNMNYNECIQLNDSNIFYKTRITEGD